MTKFIHDFAVGIALFTTMAVPICGAEEIFRLPADQGTSAVAALPVIVLPDDQRLHYSGRFDLADPKLALCSWSASAVTICFKGTAINVNLGAGANCFEVIVDGEPVKVVSAAYSAANAPPVKLYALADHLPNAPHSVTIFKCTEPSQGNAAFAGFQLDASASVFPSPTPRRKIEVIGDSISCGYGNEAADKTEHFSVATENAYRTYGAIAARALGADYECLAWSGYKLWPNNTMPGIYDRILPRNASSHWPGDKQKPDVILINLCTNDFGASEMPERAGWIKAYRDFLTRLRTDTPGAIIYCTLSPMLGDGYPQGRQSRTVAKEWIEEVVSKSKAAGDSKVRYLEFAQQKATDGFGADYHPSVKTHEIMAAKFIAALQSDLGWQEQPSR